MYQGFWCLMFGCLCYPFQLVRDVKVEPGALVNGWFGILIFRCCGILGMSLSEIVFHFSTFRLDFSPSGAAQLLYFAAVLLRPRESCLVPPFRPLFNNNDITEH